MRQETQLNQQDKRLEGVDKRLERMETYLQSLYSSLQSEDGVCAMPVQCQVIRPAAAVACEDFTFEDTPQQGKTPPFLEEEMVCPLGDSISS